MHGNMANYSEMAPCRQAVRESFASVWAIPFTYQTGFSMVHAMTRPDDRLLDVGASTRLLHDHLRQKGFQGTYKSMDVDPTTAQDYTDLKQIHEPFEVCVLLEVVEHITPAVCSDILTELYRILVPGGRLIVSTPNIFHPYAFHLGGPGHISAYPFDELGAYVLNHGFRDLHLFRLCQRHGWPWRLMRLVMSRTVNTYLGIDYAGQIMLSAIKPEGAPGSAQPPS